MNGLLYFQANDSITGAELWQSDGTELGTVLIKEINTLPYASSSPSYLTVVNNILYFQADGNSSTGSELWKSDGTASGTMIVKDIRSGSNDSAPKHFLNHNNTLYFSANDGSVGTELWKSDGTELGTILVKDISSGGSLVSNLTNYNGEIYFQASFNQLWKSDGTNAGTELIQSGIEGLYLSEFIVAGNILYFIGNDSLYNDQLWKSDGTNAGTQAWIDLYTGNNQIGLNIVGSVNDDVLFIANDNSGFKLWKTDGTTTVEIIDEMNK